MSQIACKQYYFKYELWLLLEEQVILVLEQISMFRSSLYCSVFIINSKELPLSLGCW